MSKQQKHQGPRVLLLDIETKPIEAFVWAIWQQDVGLNQIKTDSCVLSWSAKWLHAPAKEIMYADQRFADDIENDARLLRGLWKLIDEADVVITHNGKKFDIPRLNARFITHGFRPPSSFKHIDTLTLAKKHFAFTSNRLEYLTDKLCKKYKKSKHEKFSGFELWRECMKGNKKAWAVMELYNKADVLALEELYGLLIPWDSTGVNFSLYYDGEEHVCKCGSTDFKRQGWAYTTVGKFQRYRCKQCGSEFRDRENKLIKTVRVGVAR